jgi:SpoVK/Ycf46/Vps4 family AAA+-type ATPase
MATPNRTPDEAERVVAASSRELRAAAQMLETYVVNGPDCPRPIRDEAERVLRTMSYEAEKLTEILPAMRQRIDTPEAAAARLEADRQAELDRRAAADRERASTGGAGPVPEMPRFEHGQPIPEGREDDPVPF